MIKKSHGSLHGIQLKKQHGQHFLHDQSVVDTMIEHVSLDNETSVFEIGCGEGFLTRAILKQDIARLWVFEIDPEWACHVSKEYSSPKLSVFTENILDIDFSKLEPYKPWTLLANLPYVVTFPILYRLQQNRHLLKEGVIMVQEEVAQKIVKTSGRGYGFSSLYFQHFFEWQLLTLIKPVAFYPPPKVDSRLLYFKPRIHLEVISQEEEFWKFIKRAFFMPRKTLKNNLQNYHYDLRKIAPETLQLRAQQMSKEDLITLWNTLIS